jgi:periplasmic divalent cation tolerance protein
MVFIYTTCRDVEQAKDLGRRIMKARVAACVDVWPIESLYFWENELKEDHGAVLMVKTNEPKVAEIENFLTKNLTATVPIIATLDTHRLNREGKEWMTTVIKP